MRKTYRYSFLALAGLGLAACGGDLEPLAQDFISDDPSHASGDGDGDDGAGTGGDDGGEGGDGDGDGDSGDGDGEVDISEADIIQLEGDTLYALSRFSGLSVINMKNPDQMKLLGTWENDAEPFEMYVDNANAFVMFNDYYFWEYDEAYDEWINNSSSRLVALDASDPDNIEMTGEFTLPGRIQDSRRVGDILYVVTLENGYCWSCNDAPNTTVTSLDISNTSKPKVIDQLVFEAPNDGWDWQRSVESTTERMYVAARSWWGEGQGSFIDVVDISSGDGQLESGATVEVAGDVFSRWQMDEHEGIFRVISQSNEWNTEPKIETFTIESSDVFTALGTATITLPEPESLRSVRYDGDRAYAITAERTDPLFTLDLSDPANPKQIGELEIPGWVYHMETRGDRILALGFDRGSDEGSINVSLFDVGVFEDPKLVRRVHFGGDWADFAEDQNRIHKAFTILDDEEMLLVPYSGWSHDGEEGGEFCYSGGYESGIQIIDWVDDDLKLRGVAPARGKARRAFTHRERIVTVSDKAIATFDYADRDDPGAADQLAIAVHVDDLVVAGDYWVRFARDWYTDEQVLEVVSGDDPGAAQPLGVIDLADAIPESECEYVQARDIYADGDHVFVLFELYGENEYDWYERSRIVSVDVSDPTAPKVDDFIDFEDTLSWGSGSIGNINVRSKSAVQESDKLVLLLQNYKDYDDYDELRPYVQVVDLSDPSNLELSDKLDRPEGETQGTLSVFSDTVVSWHTEPVQGQPGKVRFYFDRLDLSGEPKWHKKINVPGVTVAYDAEADWAYTVDFEIEDKDMKPEACWEHPKFFDFEWKGEDQEGTCRLIERTLKRVDLVDGGAVLVDTIDYEGDQGTRELRATESRIFAHTEDYGPYGDYGEGFDSDLVVVPIDEDKPKVERKDASLFGYWWYLAETSGDRAVVSADAGQVGLVDATDVSNIDISTTRLAGYGSCWRPVMDGGSVHCPQGAHGLTTLEW